MTETIINHIDGESMQKRSAELLEEAWEARRGARRMARSGHPGRRAEGLKGVRDTSDFIRGLYKRDFARRGGLL